MKDFLLAEYKTIILVLLFCGGIFAWFYHSEILKDEAKKMAEAPKFECMEPGVWLKDYAIGKPAPQFDNTWEQTSELPGLTTWRHQGGDLVINTRDQIIKTIEYYPAENDKNICEKDFKLWSENNAIRSEPIKIGDKIYSKYKGVVSVNRTTEEGSEPYGWIILPL